MQKRIAAKGRLLVLENIELLLKSWESRNVRGKKTDE